MVLRNSWDDVRNEILCVQRCPVLRGRSTQALLPNCLLPMAVVYLKSLANQKIPCSRTATMNSSRFICPNTPSLYLYTKNTKSPRKQTPFSQIVESSTHIFSLRL